MTLCPYCNNELQIDQQNLKPVWHKFETICKGCNTKIECHVDDKGTLFINEYQSDRPRNKMYSYCKTKEDRIKIRLKQVLRKNNNPGQGTLFHAEKYILYT